MADNSSGVNSSPYDALARRRQDQTLSRELRGKRREQLRKMTQLPNSKITKRTKHTKPQAGNTASSMESKLVLTVHHCKSARIFPLTSSSKPRLPMSLFSLTSPSLSNQLHLPSLNSPLSSHPYENASSTPQPEHHTSSHSTKSLAPRSVSASPPFLQSAGIHFVSPTLNLLGLRCSWFHKQNDSLWIPGWSVLGLFPSFLTTAGLFPTHIYAEVR